MGGQGRKSRGPIIIGCTLAMVLVCLTVPTIGCADSDTGSTVQQSVSSSIAATSEPGTEPTASTTTVATAAISSTTTAAGTYVARFEGSGPVQLDMPDLEGLFIIYLKGGQEGDIRRTIITYEFGGERFWHLAYETYEGSHLVDLPGLSAGILEIMDTAAPWVVELRPVSSAETLEVPTEVSGIRDTVFAIMGDATEIEVHNLTAVWAYTTTGHAELVLNSPEAFEGNLKLPAGVTLLEIDGAGGSWRLTVK